MKPQDDVQIDVVSALLMAIGAGYAELSRTMGELARAVRDYFRGGCRRCQGQHWQHHL
jgi:hypothetical protein